MIDAQRCTDIVQIFDSNNRESVILNNDLAMRCPEAVKKRKPPLTGHFNSSLYPIHPGCALSAVLLLVPYFTDNESKIQGQIVFLKAIFNEVNSSGSCKWAYNIKTFHVNYNHIHSLSLPYFVNRLLRSEDEFKVKSSLGGSCMQEISPSG